MGKKRDREERDPGAMEDSSDEVCAPFQPGHLLLRDAVPFASPAHMR